MSTQMQQSPLKSFRKVGRATMAMKAVQFEIDGIEGPIILSAKHVRHVVEGGEAFLVRLAQQQPGSDAITFCTVGSCKLSKSGRALNLNLEHGNFAFLQLKALERLIAGEVQAAMVATPTDAPYRRPDRQQSGIDAGLSRRF